MMKKWIDMDKLADMPEITEGEAREALEAATGQVLRVLPRFTSRFPRAYSENGFYPPGDNVDWTPGFWTGEIWLAYEYTRDSRLRAAGDIQMESFLKRINERTDVETHDLGFMYSPSCVAGYKLTGSGVGREAAIKAADQLITRFHERGQFIQAWGPLNAPDNYRLIIDCLLNLPLLYWASEETGKSVYRDIAQAHIRTALANVIRPDFSTWHTFFFNRETGEPDHGATCQGYRDGSAWARGQAWGIYGTAIGYRYTREPSYVNLFKGVTDYFFRRLPKDLVPFWDLEFGDGDEEPRDSSAASIAACGLLEMARYMEPGEGAGYTGMARRLMKSLAVNYAVKNYSKSNGLVLHSTYSNHSPYNTCSHYGVDECNLWGDYFYMEALTRICRDWNPYW